MIYETSLLAASHVSSADGQNEETTKNADKQRGEAAKEGIIRAARLGSAKCAIMRLDLKNWINISNSRMTKPLGQVDELNRITIIVCFAILNFITMFSAVKCH